MHDHLTNSEIHAIQDYNNASDTGNRIVYYSPTRQFTLRNSLGEVVARDSEVWSLLDTAAAIEETRIDRLVGG